MEFFSDPSQSTDEIQQGLNNYFSLLHGLYVDVSESTTGDSKLRYAIKFKWSQSLNPPSIQ